MATSSPWGGECCTGQAGVGIAEVNKSMNSCNQNGNNLQWNLDASCVSC